MARDNKSLVGTKKHEYLLPLLLLIGLSLTISGCPQANMRVTCSPAFDTAKHKRLAVLTFDSPKAIETKEALWSERVVDRAGRVAADQMAAELTGIEAFRIIERNTLNHLLEEQALTETELIKKGEFGLAGKVLGVDAIVVGNVHELAHHQIVLTPIIKVAFSARCVDVATGEVLWTISATKSESAYNPCALLQELVHDGVAELTCRIRPK